MVEASPRKNQTKSLFTLLARCREDVLFQAGRVVWIRNGDEQENILLQSNNTVRLQLATKKYTRDKQFCNPKLSISTTQTATCDAETRSGGKCGEYIGFFAKGSDITVCANL